MLVDIFKAVAILEQIQYATCIFFPSISEAHQVLIIAALIADFAYPFILMVQTSLNCNYPVAVVLWQSEKDATAHIPRPG
ncbi:hypothetical protein ACVXG7_09180 [Enterobacter hormaechei]